MQHKVLNDLYRQGGITFFAFPGETVIPLEPLQNLALALNAGARFLVIDFSGKNNLKGNAPFSACDLIERKLSHEDLNELRAGETTGFLQARDVFRKTTISSETFTTTCSSSRK